jgi:hypothetical protein
MTSARRRALRITERSSAALTLEWVEEPERRAGAPVRCENLGRSRARRQRAGQDRASDHHDRGRRSLRHDPVDNYTLNRFTRAADPDFLWLNKKLEGQ